MNRTTGAWLCTAISFATAAWLCPQSAEAQSDAESLAALRACGAVDRDRERLACFDRALAAGLTAAPAAESAAPASPTVALAAGAAAPATAVGGPAAPAASARAAATPVAPAPVAARAPSEAPVRAADTRAEQPRIVRIVEMNAALAGAARFLTDSGQLIVQTSGGTPRGGYPDVPFDAELQDGALGSLFLAFDERRRVRVTLPD